LRQLALHLLHNGLETQEPFWPASPRYDDISSATDPALWFKTAAVEQLERAQSYSTFFGGPSQLLAWLCEQPFAPPEMHRRRTLVAARAGANPNVELCLRNETPDHLNASIWRAGKVPGTRSDP
jgi:hypothetical protein